MNNNYHSVGSGRDFLTKDQLKPLTSLWAVTPSPQTSTKYRQVRTVDVVDLFAARGWYPVAAQEQRVLKEERDGFQKHLIRFRKTDYPLTTINGHIPEIILKNAHDTTSSYQLIAGIFRVACLNGLVVSEAEFAAIRIFHLGFDEAKILEATARFSDGLPQIVDKIGEYQKIELTNQERQAFGESALLLKLNPPDDAVDLRLENGIYQIGDRQFNVPQLLAPRRIEDKTPTLWNTYNTVQEKLIKGNKHEINAANGHSKKARGITAIDENLRINRGLWHLLSELAKVKTGQIATA